MIRLEEITNQNVWKVCALRPFDSQADFVAENVQSLAEAYATRNEGHNALPLAVYDEDVLIGFVMVGKGTVGNGEESTLIRDNDCLWRLMIDRKVPAESRDRIPGLTNGPDVLAVSGLGVSRPWLPVPGRPVLAVRFLPDDPL